MFESVAKTQDTSLSQKERIRRAALDSYHARNLYTEKQVSELLTLLETTEADVKKYVLKYSTLGELSPVQTIRHDSLKRLQGQIGEIMSQLKHDQTLLMKKATKESYKQGVYHGIRDLANAQMPFYKGLTPEGLDKTTTAAFTVMDTHALDFLVNFNVQLAGDVSRELSDGIQKTIGLGIAQGKSVKDIVKDLGGVIQDKEAFRHAGKTVFKTAQQRMTLIARTETLRAHNQGRIKFYDTVGVTKLEWLALGDERMCPICGELDGKIFSIDKVPPIGKHPNCRCTILAVEPMEVCGAGLNSQAAPNKGCILSPQTIQDKASAKHGEAVKVGKKVADGEYESLTVKQLQDICVKQKIPIYMSKADFLTKLDQLEPGVDHSTLAGKALQNKIKQYGIGKVKTKDDLIKALKSSDTYKKSLVKEVAEEAQLPPSAKVEVPDYSKLTVKELQEQAKKVGISPYPTKKDYISWLDSADPGINHSSLSSPALKAKIKQHGFGKVKTKDQLIKEFTKFYIVSRIN